MWGVCDASKGGRTGINFVVVEMRDGFGDDRLDDELVFKKC